MEYVSRVPGPPLDGLIDDLYYLEAAALAWRARNVPIALSVHVDLECPLGGRTCDQRATSDITARGSVAVSVA